MSLSIGTSTNVPAYLQSLLSSGSSGTGVAAGSNPLAVLEQAIGGASAAQGASGPPPASVGTPATPPLSSGTLSALFALQSQGAAGGSGLLSQLDADGDGSVSQSEFENALTGAGADKSKADALFSKLDANGDGSVTMSDLASRQAQAHAHHHAGGGLAASGAGGSGGDSDGDATGTTTQTVVNPDGSATTTVTYADGSTSVTTTPAAPQASAKADSRTSGNADDAGLAQQLRQLQSLLSVGAGAVVSALI